MASRYKLLYTHHGFHSLPSLAYTGRFDNMHVQIVLEQPHTTWTNLDFIRGKVVMKLFSSTPISSIVVKLEGESRTRLKAAPRSAGNGTAPAGISVGGARAEDEWAGERPFVREEMHKILYRVAMVFPESQMDSQPTNQRHWTLPSGRFEYPFSFKVPFNNSCADASQAASSSLAQMTGLKKGPSLSARHVKKTLPPTLTAFPGMAEIRYFLKVTVHRKEFYKENPRIIQNLNFLPIEPPRPAKTEAETYARRAHQYTGLNGTEDKVKKGLFGGSKKKDDKAGKSKKGVPSISVDARLPTPAIITCNDDLPLRLIVKRVNDFFEQLYLESLHVQLHGITRIKANEIFRDESTNWVIISKSNIGLPLWSKSGGVGEEGEEIEIDSTTWLDKPLPNTVAPSFETCNISRKYELEIQIGIGYGGQAAKNTVVIPLHHPVQVFSGITPPAALLAAMTNASTMPSRKPISTSATPEKSAAYTAPEHLQGSSTLTSDFVIPPTAQTGPLHPSSLGPQYGPLPAGEVEPPPSYEDAIAEDLPPLDGRRREYNPPAIQEGSRGFSNDRKGSRDS